MALSVKDQFPVRTILRPQRLNNLALKYIVSIPCFALSILIPLSPRDVRLGQSSSCSFNRAELFCRQVYVKTPMTAVTCLVSETGNSQTSPHFQLEIPIFADQFKIGAVGRDQARAVGAGGQGNEHVEVQVAELMGFES
jgi:hypothetical protein